MEKHDAKPEEAEKLANDGNDAALNAQDTEVAELNEEDELSLLKKELEKTQEENKKLYDQYLRALAEADNNRKRAARDKEEYLKFAALPVIKKILPVIDDLERAMTSADSARDYEGLSKGVELICRKLHDIVREQGVLPIEAHGQAFDPQYHQALMTEESADHPENTIIDELQKGYIMHGRVIRPSLVKVSMSKN
ncbi:nucleotide exchange factor GrpE [Syntrophomonas palmitatica]|uniref:nucleotide exchange factor GrpE n=1 Tax=Syntrophomonas palmitatica TaxID=402877 RepID=UPI0006D10296|nr:nucleotide exchange factor GrpE [Syntrophomonas palmitatica]